MWFRKKIVLPARIVDLLRPGARVVRDDRGVSVEITQEFLILTPEECALKLDEWADLVVPRLRQIRGGARRMCDGDILGESA